MREPEAMLPKYDSLGNRLVLKITRALYGGKGSAGLWDSCADTWHCNYGWTRSLGDPRLYFLTDGTARISMVLATDDTSIGVPHKKYFPGSFALYEKYVAALQLDFVRPDGSSGFTTKGVAKEFCGILIDQTNPGCIALDMREVAKSIVKATAASTAPTTRPLPVPHTPFSLNGTVPLPMTTIHQILLRIARASDAFSGLLAAPSLPLSITWPLSRA
jgi:hypothetical protein